MQGDIFSGSWSWATGIFGGLTGEKQNGNVLWYMSYRAPGPEVHSRVVLGTKGLELDER